MVTLRSVFSRESPECGSYSNIYIYIYDTLLAMRMVQLTKKYVYILFWLSVSPKFLFA
jgi:hypothetical protein